jgi:hypothetical protein
MHYLIISPALVPRNHERNIFYFNFQNISRANTISMIPSPLVTHGLDKLCTKITRVPKNGLETCVCFNLASNCATQKLIMELSLFYSVTTIGSMDTPYIFRFLHYVSAH